MCATKPFIRMILQQQACQQSFSSRFFEGWVVSDLNKIHLCLQPMPLKPLGIFRRRYIPYRIESAAIEAARSAAQAAADSPKKRTNRVKIIFDLWHTKAEG